jgi:GTP cyclohydrolase I
MIDQPRVQSAVAALLEAIGEDITREGLLGTPERVARMYMELVSGRAEDPTALLAVGYEEGTSNLVVLRDISFYSLCEHHILPFFGSVHLAYLPAGRVAGASKLLRVVEAVSRRLQLQERLTDQVAEAVDQGLRPQAVAVVVEAEHLCISMRGVRKPGAKMQTYAARGLFQNNPLERAQVFQILNSP